MRELYGVGDAALAVVPNGYDETAVRPPTAGERERARAALGLGERDYAALFVGSDFPHNRAALAWIMDRVMPALAGGGLPPAGGGLGDPRAHRPARGRGWSPAPRRRTCRACSTPPTPGSTR